MDAEKILIFGLFGMSIILCIVNIVLLCISHILNVSMDDSFRWGVRESENDKQEEKEK